MALVGILGMTIELFISFHLARTKKMLKFFLFSAHLVAGIDRKEHIDEKL